MQYRREIDGLRAVAVVPVIFFHAGFEIFKGGFIGVDIFFVISGYLITHIILNELENNTFSVANFYERRARRILPALFFVVICCLPFAWMWMVPGQFAAFSKSVAAVILFVSNVHFWDEAGYFALESEFQPLLHTWSLAIEEQYYFLFPLLLIALKNRAFGVKLSIIVLLVCLSLAIGEWGWRYKPDINFFFTFSRIWELLIGSLCAFAHFKRWHRANNGLSALGLTMILISIFTYTSRIPFPSLYTLLPVIGAALVILYGQKNTLVAKLLSNKVCVGIGLISYSLYLWHQPLFAFAHIRSAGEPSDWFMLALAMMSFLLAYFTWYFIEGPFRKKPFRIFKTRRKLFTASGFIMAMFIAFGVYGYTNEGVPERIAQSGQRYQSLNIDDRLAVNFGLNSNCDGSFKLVPECKTQEYPDLLLWGDSYAMHLTQALENSPNTMGFIQHTKSGCAPLLGIAQTTAPEAQQWSRDCIAFNAAVIKWVKETNGLRYAVLSSPYGILLTNIQYADNSVSKADQFEQVVTRFKDTVDELKQAGLLPIVVSPPPVTGVNLGQCLGSVINFGLSEDTCDFKTTEFSDRAKLTHKLMLAVSDFVPVLMLDELICENGICDTLIDDILIYRDTWHLSKGGSAYLGKSYDLTGMIQDIIETFYNP